jgi:hypothetical protein
VVQAEEQVSRLRRIIRFADDSAPLEMTVFSSRRECLDRDDSIWWSMAECFRLRGAPPEIIRGVPGLGPDAPEDVGSDQSPDAGGNEKAGGSFHQVSEDSGDEDEKERDGSEQKSRASDVRMGHP